jgi:hypothetical protein
VPTVERVELRCRHRCTLDFPPHRTRVLRENVGGVLVLPFVLIPPLVLIPSLVLVVIPVVVILVAILVAIQHAGDSTTT